MRFRNLLVTLGFLTLALQFLGFPRAWDNAFYALLGLLVMTFAYLAGKRRSPEKAETQAAPIASAPEEAKA